MTLIKSGFFSNVYQIKREFKSKWRGVEKVYVVLEKGVPQL